MNIISGLKTLGLNQNEAKVYLAALELGESTVLPIAQKAKLKRTYCYDILGSLAEKGFVSYVEKRGRRRYGATQPKLIKKVFSHKLKEFEDTLPELESFYQKAPFRPKVRFYEEREGIEVILQEILEEAKEIWFLSSISDLAKFFPDYIEFIKKMVKAKLKIRDLVLPSHEALKYRHLYKKPLQEMRFLPKKMRFPTDNMIWGNKLVMISYGTGPHAVLIESAEIAQTVKVIYGVLWKSASSE